MDYKVVSLLAILVTSCVCLPDPQRLSFASKCPCGKIYLPLCASDGQSYNNLCEFECQAKYYQLYFGKTLFVTKDDLCNS